MATGALDGPVFVEEVHETQNWSCRECGSLVARRGGLQKRSSAGPTPIQRPIGTIGTIGGTFEHKVHSKLTAAGRTVEQTQTFSGNVTWEESDLGRPGRDFIVAGGKVTVTTDIIMTAEVTCTYNSSETYELGGRDSFLTINLDSGTYAGKLVQDVPQLSYVLPCQGLAKGSGTVDESTTAMQLDIKGTAETDTILLHLRGTPPTSEPTPNLDVTDKWDFIVSFKG